VTRRRRKRPPHPTGGSVRHPASLANLKNQPPTPPLRNTRALKHGARATIPRDQLDAEIREIYEAFAQSVPVRDERGELPQADEGAVEIAARALKRWRGVVAWCETYGRFEEKSGEIKRAAEYEISCERRLHEALDVLGMNPASRLKMGLTVAQTSQFDLARHWAEEESIEGEAEEEAEE
jgi:hypothetical protein